MAVTLTQSAAERVRNYLDKRGGAGLRFSVKPSGCAGFSYLVDYADQIGADDHVFESFGVKVIVDDKSLALVDGTEIDFTKDGLNQAFKFHNPRVQAMCGCGESFTI